ncbi:V-type proton ATPase subunit G [Taphrina deformans PYCC 5710]|uniref:V-type proton ATPase subunit G n=1 Tax=Taphrina deformans (strain PYCC 5710 / ATCC 11124 / CBS 356.35 / IMI 108563 / JCM 9778 / NBRC 8474) TaxID=1097556 RepID=R4X9T2_TAPDE|nr:V-type proton ATPase subunit G [Taphrina deformans PYCC 5710]|eukprot:CCG82232.1 V-type proton ATPase subunit G [Taphrina deformans PYCC 5710]
MSAQNTASIQTLLEAERDAQQIVEKARQYRTQRLKDARSEAQKEIDKYKSKKDTEYKEYEDKNSGNNDDAEKEAQKSIDTQLSEIKKSQEEGKKVIVDNLLAAIVKSDPQMHINATKV